MCKKCGAKLLFNSYSLVMYAYAALSRYNPQTASSYLQCNIM